MVSKPFFYKSQWHVFGEDFCNLVGKIFDNPSLLQDINKTLITLIPKQNVVTNRRSLDRLVYVMCHIKLLQKLSLRDSMGKLIRPCQSSFVPNRQSGDNIFVAQEVFHSMRRKSGNKGWMAIKIDLEKAYDRLKWSFIKDTLVDVGIPEKIVNLVWHCISSSSMRVLWNGEALEEFSPSRGIRQGDPLSPYLFVMCLERLFQAICLAVDQKLWKPICLSRGGPRLSHLAFADDLLLFAEASLEQVQVMQTILDLFCSSSGQKVSKEKSRMYFSKNVGWHTKQNLSDAMGIQGRMI